MQSNWERQGYKKPLVLVQFNFSNHDLDFSRYKFCFSQGWNEVWPNCFLRHFLTAVGLRKDSAQKERSWVSIWYQLNSFPVGLSHLLTLYYAIEGTCSSEEYVFFWVYSWSPWQLWDFQSISWSPQALHFLICRVEIAITSRSSCDNTLFFFFKKEFLWELKCLAKYLAPRRYSSHANSLHFFHVTNL